LTKTGPNKLIVISGPTGIGKTDLSINLVKALDSFIISADSRQVYKELSIGTAKPSPLEIKTGKIELVDHKSIHEPYSAGIFMREALDLISQAHDKGTKAILSGGTGLYIKAVCEGLDEKPQVDEAVTQQLNEELETGGISELQKELEEKDPSYSSQADIQNPYRLIRALGVIRQTNRPFSSFLNQEKPTRPFTPIHIILKMDRTQLYKRIDARVIKMIEQGLVKEVEGLLAYQELKALQTVGYKEIFKYLNGEWTLETAISEIQKNSRRYAKRQMTWNRNQLEGKYFHPQDLDSILNYISEINTSSI